MTGATLLFRQVHPSFIRAGRVTSQAFRPTPKDRSLLSVYDGDMLTPEDSWRHYTVVLGLVSVGAMAISVEECSDEGLPSRPDPEPFPEHAVVDFTGLSESQIEKKSKKLKVAAETRGWQYAP